MTNRNLCSYFSSADNKKSIQVAGHYSAHIGIAPSSKLTGSQISLKFGSIIITDMLHRPVQLLHILPNSSRSIPLLQCNVSTFPHVHSKRAGISWRTCLVAPHILTSCIQSIFSCQGTWCIRTDQRMERDTADRLLCNFKSQYFRNQLCF